MGEGTAGEGAQKMLLIDGATYTEWTPQDEMKESQSIIAEHTKDIFEERAECFEKHKLESESGIGSVTDGFVIVLGEGQSPVGG